MSENKNRVAEISVEPPKEIDTAYSRSELQIILQMVAGTWDAGVKREEIADGLRGIRIKTQAKLGIRS